MRLRGGARRKEPRRNAQDIITTRVVDAPFRDSMPASWLFFAAFARRIMKQSNALEAERKGGEDAHLAKSQLKG